MCLHRGLPLPVVQELLSVIPKPARIPLATAATTTTDASTIAAATSISAATTRIATATEPTPLPQRKWKVLPEKLTARNADFQTTMNTFSDDYDTSDKYRSPAWTDRVLWMDFNNFVQLIYYGRSELKTSDHRPVFAIFQLNTLKFELQRAEPLLKDAIMIQQNHHANVTPLIPSSGTYVNAAFELNLKEIPPQTDEGSANAWQNDESLVYANLSEITRRKELEEIDRQPIPPYPDASSHPMQPPRSTASYKFGSDGLKVNEAQHDCVASTSTDMASTAFFAEILLQREMTNEKESTLAESEIIANEPRRTADKSIMSHSLDSGINHNNHCGNSSTVPLTREHQQQSMARQLPPPDTDGAHYDTPANIAAAQQHRERAIRHGLLEKCKLADNGVRLKRRDWANSYAYLFVGHLLFYKDQKSAERTGKHYPPPTDVCDLRNASVCYTDNEKQKDKRRKHVISLILLTKTEYLFCCTGEEIGAWFQAMRQAITSTESIIEKLLRFFRSRPSMESLRERGIYKPEPVFGSTLTEICAREKTFVPKFVAEVTRLIEEKGLECDGLYRVNGNLSAVQKIRCQIDQDSYEAMQHEEDIHVLTGALKLFLRELSEPTFPVPMHKDFMSAMRETGIKRLRLIDDLLIRLPPINRETLSVLIQHLNIVATNSGKNRMQIHNLAIIFGPSLFCSDERPNHQRKFSQDKGKGGGRRKSSDKRQQQEEQVQSEPTQNLAYRMIVYGQIVEFILNETDRLAIFRPSL
uniref:PH domain-containing protein n=1 Tax=Globodera pallida TaxID=36090 RepID=A0A183BRV7_GLOPA